MNQYPEKTKRILYLLDLFPKLSETFVTNELKALITGNISIQIWACSSSDDKITDAETRTLLQHTTYFLEDVPSRYEKLKAIFFLFFRNPVHFIAAHRIIKNLSLPPSTHKLRKCYVYASRCLSHNVSHIHSHFASKAAEYAMLINILSDIPCSVTCHAYDIFLPNRRLANILDRCRFIVTISEYNKKYISNKFKTLTTPLHVIHCGIDPGKIQANITTHNLKKKIKIFSVGRLIEKKGMAYLIEACRRLLDDGLSLECEIAGDGPLYQDLQTQIISSGVENSVCLLGAISPTDVWRKLSDCDIFSLPVVVAENGDMDGIPVALMEAVAVGKPVVAIEFPVYLSYSKVWAGFVTKKNLRK